MAEFGLTSKRYIPMKPIGQGSFGIVLCAKDIETNKFVAIKKVCNIFQTKLSAKRLLRVVIVLLHDTCVVHHDIERY